MDNIEEMGMNSLLRSWLVIMLSPLIFIDYFAAPIVYTPTVGQVCQVLCRIEIQIILYDTYDTPLIHIHAVIWIPVSKTEGNVF